MSKFRRINLSSVYNFSRADGKPWEDRTAWGIARLPGGNQNFWGIPFSVGSRELDGLGLLVAGRNGATRAIQVPLNGVATYLVFVHCCDSRARTTVAGQSRDYPRAIVTAPGEHLADYVIVYADGSEHRNTIRRRFEINQVLTRMPRNQGGFMIRPHQGLTTLPVRGPYPADSWGLFQTGAAIGSAGGGARPSPGAALRDLMYPGPSWSIYALANPHPERRLNALRIEPTGACSIGIGAITAFNGAHHPLRHMRLETICVDLPRGADLKAIGTSAKIDLGVIGRRFEIHGFDPEKWLSAPVKGRGELPENPPKSLAFDVAGSPDATLSIAGEQVSLGDLYARRSATSDHGGVQARMLTPQRVWLDCKIVDADTDRPVAARVHFRSPDGRYFPPYGHRHEVNDNWFEDYGADLKLGETQYAYVEGTFRTELPVGEVYVEAMKGFEYEPLRARIVVRPGQKNLVIRLKKGTDTRKQGWVTADTHVHFISPDTARLEAEAEDLNVINVLAAQWGDLFTNVGDITGRLAGASTDKTLVWVGTENRQHFLGHISLLGVQGRPVFPMSSSGVPESYFGDPATRAMSEWADECRAKGGLVVVPHFPFPHSEVIAEIVRGRVDGIEIVDYWTPTMDTFGFHELYRMLNCGYRVAVVGGTDKMSAAMPVGNIRTYAQIGGDDLRFDSWAKAVRAGRTYTTSGPLMEFSVEGCLPGSEVKLPEGGGKLHVDAEVNSLTGPVNKLEIVYNGRVVAQAGSRKGARSLKLSESVSVPGSGWLAARSTSEHYAWCTIAQSIAAHTSAVYVKAGRDDVFDNPTAEYLITVMEGGIAWLDTLATRDTPERHAAVKRIFEEAIDEVRGRQRAHGRRESTDAQ